MKPNELNEKQLDAIAAGKKTEQLSNSTLGQSRADELDKQAEEAKRYLEIMTTLRK